MNEVPLYGEVASLKLWEAACVNQWCYQGQCPDYECERGAGALSQYRGTSLIRRLPLGPYNAPRPRALWRYYRGTSFTRNSPLP